MVVISRHSYLAESYYNSLLQCGIRREVGRKFGLGYNTKSTASGQLTSPVLRENPAAIGGCSWQSAYDRLLQVAA